MIRQFTPNWFTATMGTGILPLALNQAPFITPTLHALAEALWLFNIILFAMFCGLYLLRWIFFPREAVRIFGHPLMSLFFGAIPMSLATIINGFIAFGTIRWGQSAITIAVDLWWLDVALAVACGVGIPFLMFTHQDHSVEKMTAVWLLPIVAAEVAAASAGLLVPHLSDPEAALRILLLGYALWAYSVPLAMSILVILVLRLALHKLPHRDLAASGWLSLGPIGTAALGLLLLGEDAPRAFASMGLDNVGSVAQGLGIVGGTILIGYGAWWLLLSSMTTLRYIRGGMPFNLGWWGFIFPIGVYSVAILALGRQSHLTCITYVGGGLVVALAAFWSIVAFRTLRGALDRSLFVSPCLVKGSIPQDLADVV